MKVISTLSVLLPMPGMLVPLASYRYLDGFRLFFFKNKSGYGFKLFFSIFFISSDIDPLDASVKIFTKKGDITLGPKVLK